MAPQYSNASGSFQNTSVFGANTGAVSPRRWLYGLHPELRQRHGFATSIGLNTGAITITGAKWGRQRALDYRWLQSAVPEWVPHHLGRNLQDPVRLPVRRLAPSPPRSFLPNPLFTWTNEQNTVTITRSAGWNVTSTNAAPGSYVTMAGVSYPADFSASAYFSCAAPGSAGHFTVPPYVLQALPAGGNGFLFVSNQTLPTTFSATGIDYGFAAGAVNYTVDVVSSVILLPFLLALAASPQPRTRDVVHQGDAAIEVIAEGSGPPIVLAAIAGTRLRGIPTPRPSAICSRCHFPRPPPPAARLRPEPRPHAKSDAAHDLARGIAAVDSTRKRRARRSSAGHAFGHFVAKMTAVDYPNLVRAVILIECRAKGNLDPAVQRSVAIATDPTQPEAERLKLISSWFSSPPATIRGPWLTELPTAGRARGRNRRPRRHSAAGILVCRNRSHSGHSGRKRPLPSPIQRRQRTGEGVGPQAASRVVVIPHTAHAIIVERPRPVADAIVKYAGRSLYRR